MQALAQKNKSIRSQLLLFCTFQIRAKMLETGPNSFIQGGIVCQKNSNNHFNTRCWEQCKWKPRDEVDIKALIINRNISTK